MTTLRSAPRFRPATLSPPRRWAVVVAAVCLLIAIARVRPGREGPAGRRVQEARPVRRQDSRRLEEERLPAVGRRQGRGWQDHHESRRLDDRHHDHPPGSAQGRL